MSFVRNVPVRKQEAKTLVAYTRVVIQQLWAEAREIRYRNPDLYTHLIVDITGLQAVVNRVEEQVLFSPAADPLDGAVAGETEQRDQKAVHQ